MLKVSPERWQQAQAQERETWLAEQPKWPQTPSAHFKNVIARLLGRPVSRLEDINEGDDWNQWWAERFENYTALPAELENVVELGCGPYTNLRIILKERGAKYVICSDPLIKDYAVFPRRWLAEAWKSRQVLIDNHPIEECPFASDYFDLTVMNNVLDHVQDAVVCLQQAIRITKPGGYIIVGQDLSNAEDIQNIGFDISHPIMLDHTILDEMLLPFVSPIYYKILERDEGRNPPFHYGTYLLIGRKG